MKQITSICSSQIVVSLGGADYCSNKFPNLINLLISVTCSHHLNPRFWSGGFLLNDSTEPSIYKLSSRVPRFFLPGHGRIFLLIVRIRTVYAVPLPAFFHFFEKSCLFHLNLFFHKNSSFLIFYLVDCFCYTMNRVEEQVFFPVFLQFISYL